MFNNHDFVFNWNESIFDDNTTRRWWNKTKSHLSCSKKKKKKKFTSTDTCHTEKSIFPTSASDQERNVMFRRTKPRHDVKRNSLNDAYYVAIQIPFLNRGTYYHVWPDKVLLINQFKLTVLTRPGKEPVFIRKTHRGRHVCCYVAGSWQLLVIDEWILTEQSIRLIRSRGTLLVAWCTIFPRWLKRWTLRWNLLLWVTYRSNTELKAIPSVYSHPYLSRVDHLIKTDMRDYVWDPWDCGQDESIYFDTTNDDQCFS